MIGSFFPHYSAFRNPADGRYRQRRGLILEKLVGGGTGIVCKAANVRSRRTPTLKILPFDRTRDTDATERLIQEAQGASALQLSNIFTLHDIDPLEEKIYSLNIKHLVR